MEDYKKYIQHLRHDFSKQTLSENEIDNNPLFVFEKWFKEVVDSEVTEAQAFSLATVSEMSQPSIRIVYLRNFDENGFVFYTNYQSRKAKDIEVNSMVCMNFFWPELERQIRIEGKIIKISPAQSDEYFKMRPKESQIGSWASQQSSVLKNREELEGKVKYYEDINKNKSVERPEQWGGYIIKPHYYEFWQGRASRLHDRIAFELEFNGEWTKKRLAP